MVLLKAQLLETAAKMKKHYKKINKVNIFGAFTHFP